jgi:hypothetical protein
VTVTDSDSVRVAGRQADSVGLGGRAAEASGGRRGAQQSRRTVTVTRDSEPEAVALALPASQAATAPGPRRAVAALAAGRRTVPVTAPGWAAVYVASHVLRACQ